MVHFVGAGPGDPELITKKGAKFLENADVVIYAGSLVNPKLLKLCKTNAKIYNSAEMTLDEVLEIMRDAEKNNLTTVRLHTGDPAIYGAIAEQMDALDISHIAYDVVPGVSSFLGAAASLKKEYTLPGISQTVIITRQAGRTSVPESESLKKLATHNSTMCIFLSVHKIDEVVKELLEGGYNKNTPVSVVEKATWEDEKILWGTLENIAQKVREAGITKTAMIVVSPCFNASYEPSRLYAPDFSHEFRKAKK